MKTMTVAMAVICLIMQPAVCLGDSPRSSTVSGYDFVSVWLILALTYGLSFLLYRLKRMSLLAHRRLWNVLLAMTFLITAGFGIILLLGINYGIVVQLPLNMLYWHGVAGIAMTAISVFHLLWHRDYYLGMLKRAKGS